MDKSDFGDKSLTNYHGWFSGMAKKMLDVVKERVKNVE